MKEVTAQTFLEVMVTCPECGAVDDPFRISFGEFEGWDVIETEIQE